MVRMNICGLLWLSGWWGWKRDATCIPREGNLFEAARRVNPLTSSRWMTSHEGFAAPAMAVRWNSDAGNRHAGPLVPATFCRTRSSCRPLLDRPTSQAFAGVELADGVAAVQRTGHVRTG